MKSKGSKIKTNRVQAAVVFGQSPNSYNGLGSLVCAGKLLTPHVPCNATDPCQGNLFCAPSGDNQYFAIHQATDGKDQVKITYNSQC